MAEEEPRIRTLTEKGLDHYEETRLKIYQKVQTSYDLLSSLLEETNVDLENLEVTKVFSYRLRSAHAAYSTVSTEFADFLSRSKTESSLSELDELDREAKLIGDRVCIAMQRISDIIGTSEAAASVRSKLSRASKKSNSHASFSSSSRARAEAARIRLEYAKKEAELLKKIALIEEERQFAVARASRVKQEVSADITVLKVESDVAAAEMEASYVDEADGVSVTQRARNIYFNLPYQAASERSQDYIDNLPAVPNVETAGTQTRLPEYAFTNPNRQLECDDISVESSDSETYLKQCPSEAKQASVCERQDTRQDSRLASICERQDTRQDSRLRNSDTDVLTSFLLRKDIMPQRLKKFNEKPQSFGVWKATFKSVMKELKVTPVEEIDLLVNNLGQESQIWAESLHASNASNPERGLELIWERLENCYGSPEKVEASLKSRLEKFPQLSNKDNKRLYELSDLLLEMCSVKADPKFATQFAAYDSSSGVNAIVCKLPYNLQQKWISQAAKYKKEHKVTFPPFSVFVEFVRDASKIRNDPAFQWDNQVAEVHPKTKQRQNTSVNARVVNRKTDIQVNSENSDDKLESSQLTRCPIHRSGHSLKECYIFANKTWEDRRKLLKEKGICYKCISSSNHVSTNCPVTVTCEICMKKNHLTVMHRDGTEHNVRNSAVPASERNKVTVSSKCTSLCGQGFRGRYCGTIVLVDVHYNGQESTERVYAILDNQSNRSLISTEHCDKMNVSGESAEYILSSCSGSSVMAGRRVAGLTVLSTDASVPASFELPTLIECLAIPQDISEIPTPEVAHNFPHLNKIASSISPLEQGVGIHLLIGRDLPAAHHVMDQITGPRNSPFALRLPLGWVIIGEVCLGKVHRPDSVHTYLTNIGKDCRATIFQPCMSYLTVKEQDFIGRDVFQRSPDDNKVGLSAEDRDFIKIMDQSFVKDASGLWTAPLPFKTSRPALPDNKSQAFKRAILLKKSLERNPKKCEHLVQFMEKIFRSGAAERAPDSTENGKEKWYLPLFGVYHPNKPNQIRGVFDSSATFKGQSLNDLLLSGPNLTNSLLGVLLRFRRDKYAISADIEQMFYRFLVNTEDRDFLRFFWFENNNPEQPLTVFRMRVHVFGNKPSPAVATYGLRKTVEKADTDVEKFVARDFYVDDALASRPSRESAISLLERTKKALQDNGQIHLHKIASSDTEIMNHFPREELNNTLKDLDLDDALPAQRSLGLTWDINSDMFLFTAPSVDRPFTRRGLLSAVNSVFDPVGFVAPFTICGKILLRKACPDGNTWDDPLPSIYQEEWVTWKGSLEQLHGYQVPRMYVLDSISLISDPQIYVYADASESAIAVAAYLVVDFPSKTQIGFIMGKVKLAPRNGHSIPRLELCAAVLAVEVGSLIGDQLDVPPSSFKFFSDSKVVLGYICNRTRRFYTYVSNRVAQIHGFSTPDQWAYVPSELNPADAATRSSLENISAALNKWHVGPTYLLRDKGAPETVKGFPLQSPDKDAEIRPEVVVKATKVQIYFAPVIDACQRFSTWMSVVAAFSILIHIARTYSSCCRTSCSGWHVCKESSFPSVRKDAEQFLLSELQKKYFAEEIVALQASKPLPKTSHIVSLSPYVDEVGMLRVGGRLRKLKEDLGIASINPLIIPKGHVATLLVRHYHRQTSHQGRHFTEGAIRSNGLWIIGAKRLVSSVLHKCVICRKLRGPLLQQKMADLPIDRLSPGPAFSAVGVDVFGPWEIVTRKTRGGVANGKRWAVMFTCLTTRAAHIEVIEDMSTSCFINALRRFTALRGPVQILRSDRGSNFIGAADAIKANVINVEDSSLRKHLNGNGIIWYFNAPHASHMGGVWERAIGVARKILDSMLLNNQHKQLTHEVLCTFMAEVTAVMNSRPLVAVDTDSKDPLILSPDILLTQKQGKIPTISDHLCLKDSYRAQWKHVQLLSDTFWKRWRESYLDQLQGRRKWQSECPNLKRGDIVLLRDKALHRNHWPVAVVEDPISSDDSLVRKATVRYLKEDRMATYTRPICEMVLLLCDEGQDCAN